MMGRVVAGRALSRGLRTAGRRHRTSSPGNAHVSYDEMLHGNPLGLPRLPIPPLQDTMRRYLDSLEPLTRKHPEDMARAKAVVTDFLTGDGPTLQAAVAGEDARQQGYPHSYIERLWDDMYLCGRWALPINSNPYLALAAAPEGSIPATAQAQLVGAARFVRSFLSWCGAIRSVGMQPDKPAGCMRQYPLQWGTGRVAKTGRDALTLHPEARHVVVLCNNRMFRLDVLGRDGVQQVSEQALVDALAGIQAAAHTQDRKHGGDGDGGPFVGYLTGIERDAWAATRGALEASSELNRASLEALDSAILVVALDDDPVPDLAEEGRAFLAGKQGRNRWFDKHQLVVLKNGSMAVNFEHSYSDGMAWTRMLGEVWHDMHGVPSKSVHPLPPVPAGAAPLPAPRELQWELPEAVVTEALAARGAVEEACGGYTLDMMEFGGFGKNGFKAWKLSPDAGAQLSFHLAYYRMHGASPATYESCSTRFFFRGRTETIRSCTSEAADFVEAMDSPSASNDTKIAALRRAANKHVEVARTAQQGLGVDRHITALRNAAAAAAAATGAGHDGLGKAFFDDPLLGSSCTWLLSTSNVSNPFLSQFGFGPTAAAGYGLGYLIHDEAIRIPVTAFRGGETDGPVMAREVSRALSDVGRLLGGGRG